MSVVIDVEQSTGHVCSVSEGSQTAFPQQSGWGSSKMHPMFESQLSFKVHVLPSLQTLSVISHCPVEGMHLSIVHASPSSQLTGSSTRSHSPVKALQAFMPLHLFPSSQLMGVKEQVPVLLSQVSVVQSRPSSQTTSVPIKQLRMTKGSSSSPGSGEFKITHPLRRSKCSKRGRTCDFRYTCSHRRTGNRSCNLCPFGPSLQVPYPKVSG